MKEKNIHWNALQSILVLGIGCLGCILVTKIYWSMNTHPILRTGFAFAILSALIYLGLWISEYVRPTIRSYANRGVIRAFLIVSAILIGIIAILFQAFLGHGSVKTTGPLVLIVDRSGSMEDNNGDNTNRAINFLDELSKRIPRNKKVELYQFSDDSIKSHESLQWSDKEKPLSERLIPASGGSDYNPVLKNITADLSELKGTIVLITDCESLSVDKRIISNLKENFNFVVVQLGTTQSQALKEVADEYLEYLQGESEKVIAKFLKHSKMFMVEGMLTPSNGGAVNVLHCTFMCVLGLLIKLLMCASFGFEKQYLPSIIPGGLLGILSYHILRIPMSSDDIAPVLTYFSLLPFCILITVYVGQKQSLRVIK